MPIKTPEKRFCLVFLTLAFQNKVHIQQNQLTFGCALVGVPAAASSFIAHIFIWQP